jgi:aspartate aminotransferase
MQVSSAISGMKESATLAVSAKAAALKAKGVDVVGFGVGEPDFDTPEPIKRAAIRALEAGQTKYAPTPGDRAAREAIAHKHRTDNGIDCSFEHVTITAGAKHAIYLALQVLIERGAGNEVIVPTPAWVSYRPLVELAGARCVEVPARLEDGLVVRPEAIERAITPRTVGIILNSPSNPCGITLPAASMRAIADVLARHLPVGTPREAALGVLSAAVVVPPRPWFWQPAAEDSTRQQGSEVGFVRAIRYTAFGNQKVSGTLRLENGVVVAVSGQVVCAFG